MYSEKIFEFTQRLAKRYRTSNPFELADALGITVNYKPFTDLKGMYYIVERCAFITLSDTLDETMEKHSGIVQTLDKTEIRVIIIG